MNLALTLMAKKMSRKVLENYVHDLGESLRECYQMIEQNTSGIALDTKDTARIYLQQLGLICKPVGEMAKPRARGSIMRHRDRVPQKGRHYVEITKDGFTLWDAKEGRWVIDASCINRDKSLRISLRKSTGLKFIDHDASSPIAKVMIQPLKASRA